MTVVLGEKADVALDEILRRLARIGHQLEKLRERVRDLEDEMKAREP